MKCATACVCVTPTLSRDAKKNFRRPGAFAESGAHPNLELVPPQSTIVQWLLGVRPAAFIDSAHVSTVLVSPCQGNIGEGPGWAPRRVRGTRRRRVQCTTGNRQAQIRPRARQHACSRDFRRASAPARDRLRECRVRAAPPLRPELHHRPESGVSAGHRERERETFGPCASSAGRWHTHRRDELEHRAAVTASSVQPQATVQK